MTPDAAKALLTRYLPQAVLLLGHGSGELATELGRVYGVTGAYRPLTADGARKLRDHVQFVPASPPDVYLVELEGGSIPAQHMLLKTLEEPPLWARFIVASVQPPLKTVMSRCHVVPLGDAGRQVEIDPKVRSQVGLAVKAARQGSLQLLAQALRGWTPEHTRYLQAWAMEAVTGRWTWYTADFAPGVTEGQALQLLRELAAYLPSKLAPQVALTKVFSG